MRRHWLLALVCGWTLAAGSLQAADKSPAPLAKLELEAGDTIVFLGDSITHQCLYTQYVEDYFYTRFPGMRLRFHNSGVGGDRGNDALLRFDRDVAAYKPKYVTVLLGMNDGSYQPYNEEVFQTYRRDMTTLLEQIKEIGATAIPMTPTMYDSRAARARRPDSPANRLELYNSVLAYYGTWLREQSLERGLGFVDMYSPLNNLTFEQRKTEPEFTLIPDAVHPAESGQLVMAAAMLFDLGVQRQVSNIRISKGAEGAAEVLASGGEVTNVEYGDAGVSFEFAAESLPLVVPEQAAIGAKLVRLGHRLSREALEIHGLPAGRYELLIDGQPVGTYTHLALERHIELQENAKTPQHAQAAEVAELNRQRNDESVRPLRNLWRDQKRLRQAKVRLSQNPNDEKTQAEVAKLEQSLADMDGQIQKLEAQAKAIEDQIFQKNQPSKHRYELRRVGPQG